MKTYNPELLETINEEDGKSTPHFLHSNTCPNYCDYACNHNGFDEAEEIVKGERIPERKDPKP